MAGKAWRTKVKGVFEDDMCNLIDEDQIEFMGYDHVDYSDPEKDEEETEK